MKDFKKFSLKNAKQVTPISKGYELEYLVYQLCKGDITKRNYILQNYSYTESIEWCMLHRYEIFVEQELLKQEH